MSPNVLRHVGSGLHSLCGFQDQATILFVLDTWLREAVHHCQERILCTSLPPCGRQGIDRQLFCSTTELHVRAPILLSVCEGYGTAVAVSED